MSTHYETLQQASSYRADFQLEPPADLGPRDMWPRKPGLMLRALPSAADAVSAVSADAEPPTSADTDPGTRSATAPRALIPAQWGLVPHWVKSASDGRLRATKLVNARSETVTTSNNFRDAWLQGQRCIVPMQAFFEDDWRSGRAVPTRISRVDGKPMGVAALWSLWRDSDGAELLSYSLLTVNANSHALLHRYQHAGSEKRMLAVLNEGAYDAWLSVRVEKAKEFLRPYPANWLTANPVTAKER